MWLDGGIPLSLEPFKSNNNKKVVDEIKPWD